MAESFKPMQYTKHLSFDVTVSPFHAGQAFTCECDWYMYGAIFLRHVAPFLVCNRVASSPIPDISVSKYRGFVSL